MRWIDIEVERRNARQFPTRHSFIMIDHGSDQPVNRGEYARHQFGGAAGDGQIFAAGFEHDPAYFRQRQTDGGAHQFLKFGDLAVAKHVDQPVLRRFVERRRRIQARAFRRRGVANLMQRIQHSTFHCVVKINRAERIALKNDLAQRRRDPPVHFLGHGRGKFPAIEQRPPVTLDGFRLFDKLGHRCA